MSSPPPPATAPTPKLEESGNKPQGNQSMPKIEHQQFVGAVKSEEQEQEQDQRPPTPMQSALIGQITRVFRQIPRINRTQIGAPLFATKTRTQPNELSQIQLSSIQDVSELDTPLQGAQLQAVYNYLKYESESQSDQDEDQDQLCDYPEEDYSEDTSSEDDSKDIERVSGQTSSQKEEKEHPVVREPPMVRNKSEMVFQISTNLQPLKIFILIRRDMKMSMVNCKDFQSKQVETTIQDQDRQQQLLSRLREIAETVIDQPRERENQGKMLKLQNKEKDKDKEMKKERARLKYRFSWSKGYRSLVSCYNIGKGVKVITIPNERMITFIRCLNGMLAQFLYQTYQTYKKPTHKNRLDGIQDTIYYILYIFQLRYLQVNWSRQQRIAHDDNECEAGLVKLEEVQARDQAESQEDYVKSEPDLPNCKYALEEDMTYVDYEDQWYSLYCELMPSAKDYKHMPCEKDNYRVLSYLHKDVAEQMKQKRLKIETEYMSINSLFVRKEMEEFFSRKLPKDRCRDIIQLIKSKFTLEAFTHCYYIVTTRQFSRGESEYPVMVPLIDLLNHSQSPNCQWQYSYSKSQFFIKVIRPIKIGEELTVSYGFPGSRELFFNYGVGMPSQFINPIEGAMIRPPAKLPSVFILFNVDKFKVESCEELSIIEYIHKHWRPLEEDFCVWKKKQIRVRFDPSQPTCDIVSDFARKVIDKIQSDWSRTCGKYPRKRIQFDTLAKKRSMASTEYILFHTILSTLCSLLTQQIKATQFKLIRMLKIYLDKSWKIPKGMRFMAQTNMDQASLVSILIENILVLTKAKTDIEGMMRNIQIRWIAQYTMKWKRT